MSDGHLDFHRNQGDDFYVANWKGIDNIQDIRAHAVNHGANVWISVGDDTLIINHMHKADLVAADFDF